MTFLKSVTVRRNIVASIAAAIAFSELVKWAQRGAHRWLRVGITLALLGGCVVSPGYSSFQLARRRMAHQDSRIQAIAWLQQHAGKEKTVLAIRELMILPTEAELLWRFYELEQGGRMRERLLWLLAIALCLVCFAGYLAWNHQLPALAELARPR